jgi:hypothetical protein
MDIKISIVLKDKTYGFSDLLDGRELNNQTKEEIIHLIKEDIGYVFDQQIEVEQLTLTDVVVPKGTLCCPECKSTDLKVAIHTDYNECNKCYHYWET